MSDLSRCRPGDYVFTLRESEGKVHVLVYRFLALGGDCVVVKSGRRAKKFPLLGSSFFLTYDEADKERRGLEALAP